MKVWSSAGGYRVAVCSADLGAITGNKTNCTVWKKLHRSTSDIQDNNMQTQYHTLITRKGTMIYPNWSILPDYQHVIIIW